MPCGRLFRVLPEWPCQVAAKVTIVEAAAPVDHVVVAAVAVVEAVVDVAVVVDPECSFVGIGRRIGGMDT